MHEIENNFIHTPKYYTKSMKSTNTGHLEKERYYEHDCICSMKDFSQNILVNENRAYEARQNMNQYVNENRTYEAHGKYEENALKK